MSLLPSLAVWLLWSSHALLPGQVPPSAATAAAAPWAQLVADDLDERRQSAQALADAPDPWVPAALWLISTDPSAEVRAVGLRAAQNRCRRDSPALCARLLNFYVADPDIDLGWEARDALVARDIEAALYGAPRAYKQDLLARLAPDAWMAESATRMLLRRLSVDDDALVQDFASWLLER